MEGTWEPKGRSKGCKALSSGYDSHCRYDPTAAEVASTGKKRLMGPDFSMLNYWLHWLLGEGQSLPSAEYPWKSLPGSSGQLQFHTHTGKGVCTAGVEGRWERWGWRSE